MADMKILIAFYSRTGNVRRLAQVMAETLASANVEASVDVEEIADKKDRSGALGLLSSGWDATLRRATEIEEPKYDPAAYDLVIVGTPVWAWTMTPAVRTYLEHRKDRLPRQVAFFAIARSAWADRTVAAMAELAGKQPVGTLSLTRGRGLGDEILEHARRFAAGLIPAP